MTTFLLYLAFLVAVLLVAKPTSRAATAGWLVVGTGLIVVALLVGVSVALNPNP